MRVDTNLSGVIPKYFEMIPNNFNVLMKVHAALDVFLCTSSILNLCLISLDRYWSVAKEDKLHF